MVAQKAAVLAGLLLCVFISLACTSSENTENAKDSVILVTVDTLGAGHVGCYGASENRTPAIDALAARGVRFSAAVSQSSWTLPSLASLMTSRYPGQLGLKKKKNRLPSSVPLLSTIMGQAGYRTAAVVTNPYLAPVFGFNRDFDEYLILPPEAVKEGKPMKIPRGTFFVVANAEEVTRAAVEWLNKHGEEKYFLWIHYMDPHVPYASLKTGSVDLAGPIRKKVAAYLKNPVIFHERGKDDPIELTLEEKEAVRKLYREDIVFFDRHFGKLLDTVREKMESGRLLLVFASDHGEEFWEHGGFEHGHTLYDELLMVPLIIACPGKLPVNHVVKSQVGLIDIIPTILDLCSIEPPAGITGKNLVELIHMDTAKRPAFSEGILWGDELKSLRTEAYKLIYDPEAGDVTAYDLRIDPGERHPISGAENPAIENLHDRLLRMIADHEEDASRVIKSSGTVPLESLEETETGERLQALGYILEEEDPSGSKEEDDLDRGADAD